MRILLVNPNTTDAATERMGRIASRVASSGIKIRAMSAPSGIPLIQTSEQSARAAEATVGLLEAEQDGFDAAIIAAFTDPGLDVARTRLTKPVVGIAESAMLEAASGGRRFAIVTLGQGLVAPLHELAARYGVAPLLAGIRILPEAFAEVAYAPERHADSFRAICRDIVAKGEAEAMVIGGGPLAGMADQLSADVPVPLFDGVVCAVRRVERMLRGGDWPGNL